LRGEVEIMAVTMLVTQALFPSPCGDKLKSWDVEIHRDAIRFRPLAGIS